MSSFNSAQDKHRIDRGEGGDKAPGFDPAAAPLGTDEEAAGTPARPDPMHTTRRPGRPAGLTASPEDSIAPDAMPARKRGTAGFAMAIVVLALVAIAVALWAH